jgi:hypothetical protein
MPNYLVYKPYLKVAHPGVKQAFGGYIGEIW